MEEKTMKARGKKVVRQMLLFLAICPSAALAAPDLGIDVASVAPYPAYYGHEITVRFSVKNFGDQVSTPSTVELSPSLQNDYVYDLKLPRTVNIPALAPLQSSEVFTFQRTIDFQRHGIGGIKLQIRPTTPENNQANNERIINVYIYPQGSPEPTRRPPDLTGGGITLQPPNPRAGQPLALHIIVKNAGPGPMPGPAKAAIYMFKDNQAAVDMAAAFGGQYHTSEMIVTIPPLPAGQPHQIALNGASGLAAGHYRMTVAINKYYDTILETNYNNNDMSFNFSVLSTAPDRLKLDVPLPQLKPVPSPKPPDPGPAAPLKTAPAVRPPAGTK
jgi:hypothetical protein